MLLKDFRDPWLAKRIVEKIHEISPKKDVVKICHVCGTHEWTISHYGIRSLLPSNVDVIAGPGCPVCIVPASEVDEAIELALKGATLICFGDAARVPGSQLSLIEAKAKGADIQIVYSVMDAVKVAEKEPNREFVFFAIGFETTAPLTAYEVLKKPPRNLSFLISHRLIPPAMELMLGIGDLQIDAFIAPGHVSTIIGLEPYEVFPKVYRMPTIVAGFEPIDVLLAIYMALKQIKNRIAILENEYKRAVKWDGNVKAKELIKKAFKVVSGNWRGLGRIPDSTLALREEYLEYDAHEKHGVRIERGMDIPPGCQCHLVIIGKIKPIECPLFMKACTPQKPVGSCMVGIEGTCRIWASARQELKPKFI
ncbi:MAG: hydrogenase formation protein HypD [Candidatus Bathyarchaeia archaeon]|nr:hydrogenase formation protein HypD [Candidatus Bathyarchaeota archaeon]